MAMLDLYRDQSEGVDGGVVVGDEMADQSGEPVQRGQMNGG